MNRVNSLQHKYPHYTPYRYAGNKPISYIDRDGLEEDIKIIGQGSEPVVYNKVKDKEAYENAKKQYFLAFTGNQETEGYKWETGYNEYSLGHRGEDTGWYGPSKGTLTINTIGDKIQLAYSNPGQPKDVSIKESFESGLHAMNVFFVNPDPNVEGSAEYRKAVLGYTAMVGGAYAMAATEPYMAQGILKGIEYSGKAIDAANKFIINNPKLIRITFETIGLGSAGPDLISMPGKASRVSELIKFLGILSSNPEYFLELIPERDNIHSLQIPFNPVDNTRFQNELIDPMERSKLMNNEKEHEIINSQEYQFNPIFH